MLGFGLALVELFLLAKFAGRNNSINVKLKIQKMRKINGDPGCGFGMNPVLVVGSKPYFLIQKGIMAPERSFVSKYAIADNLLDHSTGFRAVEGFSDSQLLKTEPNKLYEVIGYGTIEFINETEGFVIYNSSEFKEEVMFILKRAYPNIPVSIV